MIPLAGQSNLLSSPGSRYSDGGFSFPRAQSVTDFEVEHSPGSPSRGRRRTSSTNYDSEAAYMASIAALVTAKARPFAVSGRIPVDPLSLTLFFRSKVRHPITSTSLKRSVTTEMIERDYTFS